MQAYESTDRSQQNPTPAQSIGTHRSATESLVVRNYDNESQHSIRIELTDDSGTVVFDRTVTITQRETTIIQTELDRAVYRVHAQLPGGASARADCLLGSDPGECAMIETGNGVISVSEEPF